MKGAGAVLFLALISLLLTTGCGLTSSSKTQASSPPPPPGPLTITTTSLPQGQTGQPYSATLQATGGTPGYTWSIVSGQLPAGLSLMAATGEITGTPISPGQSNFTAQVKDSAATPATATQALTLTVVAGVALDQYGGRIDLPCAQATGWFHTEKINNRWWLCTPAGHAYFFEGVGDWTVGGGAAKYGTNNNAGLQTQNEALAWNFNGVGQKTYGGAVPCPGCVENPCTGCKALPMIQTFEILARALTDADGYSPPTVVTKNLTSGVNSSGQPWFYKPLLDVFDANMVTYFTAYVQAPNNGNGFQLYKSNPNVVGVMVGDNDFFLGVGPGPDFDAGGSVYGGGHNESDPGRIVLTTSPIRTFDVNPAQGNVGDRPELYTDTKVYTKTAMASPPATCSYATPCTLRDYLAKKYGTIAALNAAWGSNYTTFDSSGTSQSQVVCTSTVWTGSNTSCSDTLSNLNVSPHSVQVLVDGVLHAGDCPWFDGTFNHYCGSLATNTGYLGGGTDHTFLNTSSINYVTGAVTINFMNPPSAGSHTITINYVQNGWTYGTGVMDEDGRHSWTGANVVCLMPVNGGGPGTDSWACRVGNPGGWGQPTANVNLAADIEDWIGQYSAKFFSSIAGVIHGNTSVPFMGVDSVGIWMQPSNKNVYKGAAGNIDIMFQELGWSPDDTIQCGCTTQADFDAAWNYITQNYGDHPVINFWEANANADSAEGGFNPSGVLTFSSQAHRGQGYYNVVNEMLNKTSFNGTYQWVGISWWGWQDFPSELTDWGLKTVQDNAYDGNEPAAGTVSCSPPLQSFTCGSQPAPGGSAIRPFGDAISGVKSANQLWLTIP